jgi:hypothetical protein
MTDKPTDIHMIRVDDATYERLRRHVFELHLSYSKVIAVLLDGYDAGDPDAAEWYKTAPRTPEQRAQDAHAAQGVTP